MTVEVTIRNRQRTRRVDVRRLRRIGEALLAEELALPSAVLGVQLIGARAMAALNWRWLRHEGSTDILTFDERHLGNPGGAEGTSPGAGPGEGLPEASSETEALRGELFISVDDAVCQAREFGTSPGAELVRYLVHGVLHLRGFDDLEAAKRRIMKRAEDRLVRRLAERFSPRGLLR